MEAWIQSLLAALALPKFGLSTVFAVAFVSATLLPLGSEPAVFGLVKLNPDMFWPAIVVASVGNTLGGALTWWMGYVAEQAYERVSHRKGSARARVARALRPEGLPPRLVARRRRSAVRGRRLVEAALLALRRLHVDRQVPALFGDDERAAVVLPERQPRAAGMKTIRA
jgi:hypothetical protein